MRENRPASRFMLPKTAFVAGVIAMATMVIDVATAPAQMACTSTNDCPRYFKCVPSAVPGTKECMLGCTTNGECPPFRPRCHQGLCVDNLDRTDIQGISPVEPGPGEALKGAVLTRGFKRYWIDRLDVTPEVFSMGQGLQQARIMFHCQPACLDVDRVSDVAFEIHHRRGPGPNLLIAVVRPLVLSPKGGGCPPGGAMPNAGCVTLSINPSFQTAPGVFEVTLIKEQDRINRAFPIVPVGDGRRFRAGGQ